METILDALRSFWDLIIYVISNFRLVDILDIFVIAFLIYYCIKFFRQTRAGQLIKGIIVLIIFAFVAHWLDMVTVNWIMVKVVDSILIAAVIIFHPEIRRALERVGTSRFGQFGLLSSTEDSNQSIIHAIDATSKAAAAMQEQKCGALMVFERKTQLGEIVSTGTVIDSGVSSALITNIFFPKSPLHDGAMILRDGRILAAGCILPLSQTNEINKSLGTRHRAAIGMSENSDAVVVIVSEETGNISLAVNGELKTGFSAVTLHTALTELLVESEEKSTGFLTKALSFISSKMAKNKKEK